MRIGVDLGGTKTEIICLNADNGKELYRQRVPSPRDDYPATIRNIAEMVALAEEKTGQKGSVGVGIPGTVSQVTGKVKNANSVWLNGNALDKDLEAALNRPVRVENDASRHVLETCGFEIASSGLKGAPARGGLVECHTFRLTRDAWTDWVASRRQALDQAQFAQAHMDAGRHA